MEKQMDTAVKAAVGAAPALPNVSLMPDVFAFKTVRAPKAPSGTSASTPSWCTTKTPSSPSSSAYPVYCLVTASSSTCAATAVAISLQASACLQVLTPRRIEPERFHFINSAITLDLCDASAPTVCRSGTVNPLGIETGEIYSQGFALEDIDDYNRLGQQYQGPIVLIIDALCYSTTDIFTAGFQDHKIGKILGVHQHTGAGGANVWEYRLLGQVLPNYFGLLPEGAAFRVALRRTTRVRRPTPAYRLRTSVSSPTNCTQ